MTTTTVTMTETELLNGVLAMAEVFGWTSAHFRPAQTSHGWRAAVSGAGKGFPDVVLVRDHVLFVELKSTKGSLSPEQVVWRDVLVRGGASWHLWRPADWLDGTIERVLRGQEVKAA